MHRATDMFGCAVCVHAFVYVCGCLVQLAQFQSLLLEKKGSTDFVEVERKEYCMSYNAGNKCGYVANSKVKTS